MVRTLIRSLSVLLLIVSVSITAGCVYSKDEPPVLGGGGNPDVGPKPPDDGKTLFVCNKDCPAGQKCNVTTKKCEAISGTTPECKKDEDCPSGKMCKGGQCEATGGGGGGGGAVCGNGIKEGTEACDDGAKNTDSYSCPYGVKSCKFCAKDCTQKDGATSYCGDKIVDAGNGEGCDSSFEEGCSAQCKKEKCVPKSAGLVSWWGGDGVADGVTPNFTDALLYGALAAGATIAPGRVGNGFKFDGLKGYVEVGDNAKLRPDKVTVAAWVKLDEAGNVAHGDGIVSKQKALENSASYELLALSTDALFFRINNKGPTTDGSSVQSDAGVLTLYQFHHVVGTYDGTRLAIYVDGTKLKEVPAAGPIAYDDKPLTIGIRGRHRDGAIYTATAMKDGSFSQLKGLIDEVQIFNRALSDLEIKTIFDAGREGTCTASRPDTDEDGVIDINDACPATPRGTPVNAAGCPADKCLPLKTDVGGADFDSGLVSWWAGDGDTNDLQKRNDGVFKGTGIFAKVGKVGGAFTINPAALNYVDVPSSDNSTDPVGAWTLDAWIKRNSIAAVQFIASKYDGDATHRGYYVRVAEDKLEGFVQFSSGEYIACKGTSTLTTATWYHIAVTFNNNGNTLRCYVNGTLEDEKVSGTGAISTKASTSNFRIGVLLDGLVPFNGPIDEVDLFKRELSPGEIQAIYLADKFGKCKP